MKVEETEALGKIGCGSERKNPGQLQGLWPDQPEGCRWMEQARSENASSWKCGTDVRGGWLYKPRMQGRYLSWREKKMGEEQRY